VLPAKNYPVPLYQLLMCLLPWLPQLQGLQGCWMLLMLVLVQYRARLCW
jgi:hypothetical protein